MQRSFSVIDDDTLSREDAFKDDTIKNTYKNDISPNSTDSEEDVNSPKRFYKPKVSSSKQTLEGLDDPTNDIKSIDNEKITKLPSAGPSGRPTAVPRQKTRNEMKILHISSDSEDSENEDRKLVIPGEYDPKLHENLEVDEDAKDMFQFILKYIPQQLNLDYKFKPFIPEYLPAVGDIDAFLKVIPPEKTLTGEECHEKFSHLGLTVLDEPATNQSDPALLYLQLRAASVNPSKRNDGNVVVKKVDNIEKNAKIIDKWIKDISDLHKSKSSPIVRYSEPMPDLDDLMQEWPEEVEKRLKQNGFPAPNDMSLSEYVDTVCSVFQIPIAKKKIQSLHLLFCLYAAIKQTQLYQSSSMNEKLTNISSKKEADQLVLD
ncbi:intraflagellar transport 46 [Leptinotarsa decemlineata]|uniref:intraflagellar transport 46 n=1 Tax=Leptinotarsa decemlineata TaxID=7539 RepID=UPI003D30632A